MRQFPPSSAQPRDVEFEGETQCPVVWVTADVPERNNDGSDELGRDVGA